MPRVQRLVPGDAERPAGIPAQSPGTGYGIKRIAASAPEIFLAHRLLCYAIEWISDLEPSEKLFERIVCR